MLGRSHKKIKGQGISYLKKKKKKKMSEHTEDNINIKKCLVLLDRYRKILTQLKKKNPQYANIELLHESKELGLTVTGKESNETLFRIISVYHKQKDIFNNMYLGYATRGLEILYASQLYLKVNTSLNKLKIYMKHNWEMKEIDKWITYVTNNIVMLKKIRRNTSRRVTGWLCYNYTIFL
jgi:tRNA/tmRNA/rRNA uracil-C5-methylase (TrmA/RlmC/RlmD family)